VAKRYRLRHSALPLASFSATACVPYFYSINPLTLPIEFFDTLRACFTLSENLNGSKMTIFQLAYQEELLVFKIKIVYIFMDLYSV